MTRNANLGVLKKYVSRHEASNWINTPFNEEVSMVVVIPAYLEGSYLFKTLECLLHCTPPVGKVGVIVVINASERDNIDVIKSQQDIAEKLLDEVSVKLPSWIDLKIIEAYGLRTKHFGAGLARKIGMDAACFSFYQHYNPQGIIISLDADTRVATNYFTAIESWFTRKERSGANIFFEHPLDGSEFDNIVYNGITSYELHLRYLRQGLRYAGFPYSFHSMGSAIAFRCAAYARAGGMPRKQAGEDFYFLQKLIPMGQFGEINSTFVSPSPRPSSRVIFGTGAAIKGHVEGTSQISSSYNITAFHDLKPFIDSKNELFHISETQHEKWTTKFSGPLKSYLLNSGVLSEIETIKKDVGSEQGFERRFFEAFNSFAVVKYLNWVHDHFFKKMPVFDASIALLELQGHDTGSFFQERELLYHFRDWERNNPMFFAGNATI